MGYIIWMIFLTLIAGVAFVACLIGRGNEDPGVRSGSTLGLVGVPVLFAIVVGISTAMASAHQVPAGHVGVVYTFGDITGQTGSGLVWYGPCRGSL